MKKILTIAAACVALVACNEKFIASPVNDGFGYLDINLSTNDDIVVSTKAAATLTAEQAANYTLTLNNESNNTWSKKYSEITDSDKKVTPGSYTLAAENISETDAETNNGAKRIYGISESFQITAGAVQNVTVNCAVVNSAVTVAFDSSFDTYFKSGYTVEIKKGTRSFTTAGTEDNPATLTAGHEENNQKFYNLSDNTSENVLICTITATLTNENTAQTYTTNYTLTKATWHKLTFKASSDKGQIGVITISVDETLTPDAKDVTIDPISPDTTPEESAE